MPKKSIRFYNDRQVRAVWDEDCSIKGKMAKDGVELVSITTRFKSEDPVEEDKNNTRNVRYERVIRRKDYLSYQRIPGGEALIVND